jgi:hypothetical protein
LFGRLHEFFTEHFDWPVSDYNMLDADAIGPYAVLRRE